MDLPSARNEALARLRPPPRGVPLRLALRETFGTPLAFVGWLFLFVGTILTWTSVAPSDLALWRYLGNLEHADAVVTGCAATNASINKTRVYGNNFSFDGLEGVSYATGYCMHSGTRVQVEFPPGRPRLARIAGQRATRFGLFGLFVLIFPLVGAALAYTSLCEGLRSVELLKNGVLAKAKLVDKKPTNVKINDRRQFAMTLAFKDRWGMERRFVAKTCFPETLEDEAAENILYNPEDPAKALAVDALPAPLFVDDSGELQS